MARLGAVQLVRKSAEKAISVAGCVGRVEAELTELFRELLCVCFWVGEELVRIKG